ncbi:hypothetical protein [Pseudodesulfovibrio mercurii]|uniref:hypothetical protein n=1 Tax=Pseudodesulfovibrio mercurii TaxID=641491 RepID=UPI0011D28FF3|nr:hypothetical protein [Pseudodesulfovibrio mercurii]
MADTGQNPMIPKKRSISGNSPGRGKKACGTTGRAVTAGSSAQAFHNNATSNELYPVALYKESIQIPEEERKTKPGNVQL